jgi:DNA-binding winged helix-turn-helix (wHTH) protein/tetratricopeptide (TPR) repeat protein
MAALPVRFADYHLVTAARELWRGDRLLPTTPLVFDCLAYLIQHRDRAVGRDELVSAVWGKLDVNDNQVNQLILRVRRTFGDDARMASAIRTVPGFGYRWIVDASEPHDRRTNVAAIDLTAEPARSPDQAVVGPVDTQSDAPVGSSLDAMRQTRRMSRGVRAGFFGIVAALLAAVGIYLIRWTPDGNRLTTSSITEGVAVVLPLIVTAPPDASWVRLGAMDLVAERLREAGLRIPPTDTVLVAAHGVGDITSNDGQRRLKTVLDAELAVAGTARRTTSDWVVELEATSPNGLRHHARSENVDVIEATRQAADIMASSLGRVPPVIDERSPLAERVRQVDAALLANELDAASAIIEAIPFPDRSDPLLHYLATKVDMHAGRFEHAEQTLSALLADPRVLADSTLLGRVQSSRGAIHGRRGEFADAERDFEAAAQSLRGSSDAIDLAKALNGRGTSRLGLRRFDDAARDFGAARVEFVNAGDALGTAQADANLGLLDAQQGRLEQAVPRLTRAVDRFEELGASERALAVMIPLFDAQCDLLRWGDALKTSERQWALRERATDPGLGVQIDLNRATALLNLGRRREAETVFAEAAKQFANGRPDTDRYLKAFDATLALHKGNFAHAALAASQALAEWPLDPTDALRAAVELDQQRALDAVGGTTAEVVPTPNSVALDPDAAPARLLVFAERSASRHQDADAEAWFERSRTTAEHSGVPAHVALVATAYGKWLIDHDRAREASGLAGRVAPWAEQDFECAVLQVAVHAALGQRAAWSVALGQARQLAGERSIPSRWTTPPSSP